LIGALLPLAAGPVLAQPIIIPLQRQSPPGAEAGRPNVSAPPIAPPEAGPSLPSTTDMAGTAPSVRPPEEAAQQPQQSR
jgi:hypothetical protein